MQFIRDVKLLKQPLSPCVATIGNFDGLHVGHQSIILKLQKTAEKCGLPLTVVLFEPHPIAYFRPEAAPKRLTRLTQKLTLLSELGVDTTICLRFNAALANLTAEDFITDILVSKLNVKHLLVGDDFRFGKNRGGDYALLKQLSDKYQYHLDKTESILLEETRVSSTQIRDLLSVGDCEGAAKRLGREFILQGRVGSGAALGRDLGAPTANIRLRAEQEILPYGVYVVRAEYDGNWHPAVASYGVRPTVSQQTTPVLEVYLLEGEHQLYGKKLRVAFHYHIRPELKFDSLNALQQAIVQDVRFAKDYHAKLC